MMPCMEATFKSRLTIIMEIRQIMSIQEQETLKDIITYFKERGLTVITDENDPCYHECGDKGRIGMKRAIDLYWKYQFGS